MGDNINNLNFSSLAQMTKFIFVFLLIFSSCTTYDTEKKLNSNLTVTDCFTQEEIKDLAKLLDFFNEQIGVSKGMDKKEIIECYDSFVERMYETMETGNFDIRISFDKQKEIYNQISDSLFNQIWRFGERHIWERDSPSGTFKYSDTLRYIDCRMDGKYAKFLKEFGKENEMAEAYSESLETSGGISPTLIFGILRIKKHHQYDLNDIRLQLVLAIHYLTLNDQYERKEKYYSIK